VLEDGPAVWGELMTLTHAFSFGGKQVHDANIVATMLAHGETRLSPSTATISDASSA
jgi:hypothetical protein